MAQSSQLFAQAQEKIPGGVNSPVRAFRGVEGEPLFIQSGHGPYLVDADGKEYVDYVGSWGPLIAGHANPYVLEKVEKALKKGFSFGAPTEIEVQLAQKVCELMPSIEMVRFVSSGTEAAMSAIRVARGFTKRDKLIKFADSLLVAAGSGALTLGITGSAGVPESVAQHTLTAEFNHLDQVKALFEKYGNDIACIIVEPVAGNMNLVLPEPGFLQGLRDICDQYQSLLIFDEVMTGFRVALGGAQAHYRIKPDMTVLGKIIGGGFPAAAFGGRKDIMQIVAPLGPVYQAGTLSGNPIAMTAGLAMMDVITAPGFYENLEKTTQSLMQGLRERAQAAQIPFYAHSIGSMFGLYFTTQKNIQSEKDAKACDVASFKKFFKGMLDNGIYLAPSAFEAGFVSSAHTKREIEKTLLAAELVFPSLRIP
jgi:glutamate-1-semialdehyde 2,1-aminomutase